MGYHTSNAAYAYDIQPDLPAYRATAPAYQQAPRPNFDVVTGHGREADQDVSPRFTYCMKVAAALMAMFIVLGLFRVTLAGATTAVLNNAATLSNELTTAQEQSSELEVMRSVYGSPTRIRDLAEGYGMVVAEGGVTLDFTEYVPAGTPVVAR